MPRHIDVTRRVLRCAAGVGEGEKQEKKKKNTVEANLRSTAYFS
jgi:hypothetical protein